MFEYEFQMHIESPECLHPFLLSIEASKAKTIVEYIDICGYSLRSSNIIED